MTESVFNPFFAQGPTGLVVNNAPINIDLGQAHHRDTTQDIHAGAIVRDIYGHTNNPASLMDVQRRAGEIGLSGDHVAMLRAIHAAVSFSDRNNAGGDIIQLLDRHRGDTATLARIIEHLHTVATAQTLFGKERSDASFLTTQHRFIRDLIAGATSADRIIQGERPFCTATSAVQMLASQRPSEFTRLASDYAVHGYAITSSGTRISLSSQFMTQSGVHGGPNEVRVYRPSQGMEAFIRGVMSIGTDANLHDRGAYRQEYGRTYQDLLGFRVYWDEMPRGERLTPEEEGARRTILGELHRRAALHEEVPIDMFFGVSGSAHARHNVTVVGLQPDFNTDTGQNDYFYILRNPQGMLLQNGREYSRGDWVQNGNFRFQVVGGGLIRISASTLTENLRGVIRISGEQVQSGAELFVAPEGGDLVWADETQNQVISTSQQVVAITDSTPISHAQPLIINPQAPAPQLEDGGGGKVVSWLTDTYDLDRQLETPLDLTPTPPVQSNRVDDIARALSTPGTLPKSHQAKPSELLNYTVTVNAAQSTDGGSQGNQRPNGSSQSQHQSGSTAFLWGLGTKPFRPLGS